MYVQYVKLNITAADVLCVGIKNDNYMQSVRLLMGKKLPYTPNSRIRSTLRQLFLRSRERNLAIKRDNYTCQECGAKQSKAKGKEVEVEVHHKGEDGVKNWAKLFEAVREYLLCDPEYLEVLCKTCHKSHTDSEG